MGRTHRNDPVGNNRSSMQWSKGDGYAAYPGQPLEISGHSERRGDSYGWTSVQSDANIEKSNKGGRTGYTVSRARQRVASPLVRNNPDFKSVPTSGRTFYGPSVADRPDIGLGRAKADASAALQQRKPQVSRRTGERPKPTGKAGVRRTRSTDL